MSRDSEHPDIDYDKKIVRELEAQITAARALFESEVRRALPIENITNTKQINFRYAAAEGYRKFVEGFYIRGFIELLQFNSQAAIDELFESRAKLFEGELRSAIKSACAQPSPLHTLLEKDMQAVLTLFNANHARDSHSFQEFMHQFDQFQESYLACSDQVEVTDSVVEIKQVSNIAKIKEDLHRLLRMAGGFKAQEQKVDALVVSYEKEQHKLARATYLWLEKNSEQLVNPLMPYAQRLVLIRQFYGNDSMASGHIARLEEVPRLSFVVDSYVLLAARISAMESSILNIFNLSTPLPNSPIVAPMGYQVSDREVKPILLYALALDRDFSLLETRDNSLRNTVASVFSGVKANVDTLKADLENYKGTSPTDLLLRYFSENVLDQQGSFINFINGDWDHAELCKLIHFLKQFSQATGKKNYKYMADVLSAIIVVFGGDYKSAFDTYFSKRVALAVELSKSLISSSIGTKLKDRNLRIDTIRSLMAEPEIPLAHKCVIAVRPILVLLYEVFKLDINSDSVQKWYHQLVSQLVSVKFVLMNKDRPISEIAKQGEQIASELSRLIVKPMNKVDSQNRVNLPTLVDVMHLEFSQVAQRSSQEMNFINVGEYACVQSGQVSLAKARCHMLALYNQVAGMMFKLAQELDDKPIHTVSAMSEVISYLEQALSVWMQDNNLIPDREAQLAVASELDLLIVANHRLFNEVHDILVQHKRTRALENIGKLYHCYFEKMQVVYQARLGDRPFPAGNKVSESAAARDSQDLGDLEFQRKALAADVRRATVAASASSVEAPYPEQAGVLEGPDVDSQVSTQAIARARESIAVLTERVSPDQVSLWTQARARRRAASNTNDNQWNGWSMGGLATEPTSVEPQDASASKAPPVPPRRKGPPPPPPRRSHPPTVPPKP